MGKLTDLDHNRPQSDFMLSQDTDDGDFLRGLTVTQSQLARLFGVSKQAVNAWVRDGKIKINAVGRIDPNQALADLLTGSDPSRLRITLLRPVRDEIERLTAENQLLSARLDSAIHDVEFHEGVVDELANILKQLEYRLETEWHILAGVERRYALAAIGDWIEEAQMNQENTKKHIIDYLQVEPPTRRVEKKGGGGVTISTESEVNNV